MSSPDANENDQKQVGQWHNSRDNDIVQFSHSRSSRIALASDILAVVLYSNNDLHPFVQL